jgi:hypothetical protein
LTNPATLTSVAVVGVGAVLVLERAVLVTLPSLVVPAEVTP